MQQLLQLNPEHSQQEYDESWTLNFWVSPEFHFKNLIQLLCFLVLTLSLNPSICSVEFINGTSLLLPRLFSFEDCFSASLKPSCFRSQNLVPLCPPYAALFHPENSCSNKIYHFKGILVLLNLFELHLIFLLFLLGLDTVQVQHFLMMLYLKFNQRYLS